ncbi:MAG: hypothetical protein OXF02_04930 [Simkaniaceae bacterium]|nr:hypothetical protein [Simkaniaceae bacterium]
MPRPCPFPYPVYYHYPQHPPMFHHPYEVAQRVADLFRQTEMTPYPPPPDVALNARTEQLRNSLETHSYAGNPVQAEQVIGQMRLSGVRITLHEVIPLWYAHIRHDLSQGVFTDYYALADRIRNLCGTSNDQKAATTVIFENLLREHMRLGSVEGVHYATEGMRRYGFPPGIDIYNQVIRCYRDGGHGKEIKQLLDNSQKDGVVPNNELAETVFEAYRSADDREGICEIFATYLLPSDLVPDASLLDNLIPYLFAKGEMAKRIVESFATTLIEKMPLSHPCHTTMMREAHRSFPPEEVARLADVLLQRSDREAKKAKYDLSGCLSPCKDMFLAYLNDRSSDRQRTKSRITRLVTLFNKSGKGDRSMPDNRLIVSVLRTCRDTGNVEGVYEVLAEHLLPADIISDTSFFEEMVLFLFDREEMTKKTIDLLERTVAGGVVLSRSGCASMIRKANESFPPEEAVRLADTFPEWPDRDKSESRSDAPLHDGMVVAYRRGFACDPEKIESRITRLLRLLEEAGEGDATSRKEPISEILRTYAKIGDLGGMCDMLTKRLLPGGFVLDESLFKEIILPLFNRKEMAEKAVDISEKILTRDLPVNESYCTLVMRAANNSFSPRGAVRLADIISEQLEGRKYRSTSVLPLPLCKEILLAYQRGCSETLRGMQFRIIRFATMIRESSLRSDDDMKDMLKSVCRRAGPSGKPFPLHYDDIEPETLCAMIIDASGGVAQCRAVLRTYARTERHDPEANRDRTLRLCLHMWQNGITLDEQAFETMKEICCLAGNREGIEYLLQAIKNRESGAMSKSAYRALAKYRVGFRTLFGLISGFPGEDGMVPDIVACRERCNAALKACAGGVKGDSRSQVIVEAQRFFEYMREVGVTPDAHSFTSLIIIHYRGRKHAEAGRLIRSMIREGTQPDYRHYLYIMHERVTPLAIVRVLTSSDPGEDPLSPEVSLHHCNAVLDACMKDTDRNAVARSKSMHGCFDYMERDVGLTPDRETFHPLIEACLANNDHRGVKQHLRCMRQRGIHGNKITSLIRMEWESDAEKIATNAKEALHLLTSAESEGVSLDTPLFNRVVRICCLAGDYDGVGVTLQYMIERGYKPNLVTYQAIIDAKPGPETFFATIVTGSKRKGRDDPERCLSLCRGVAGAFTKYYTCLSKEHQRQAAQFLAHMGQAGIVPDTLIFDKIMETCCRPGKHGEAGGVLREMVKGGKGVRPNSKTYANMIYGGEMGPGALFDVIVSAHPAPGPDGPCAALRKQCNTALGAYAEAGNRRQPEKEDAYRALQFSSHMKRIRIIPYPAVFEAIVDMCCRFDDSEGPVRNLQRSMGREANRATDYEAYSEAVRTGMAADLLFEIVTGFHIPAETGAADFVSICRNRCRAVCTAYSMLRSDRFVRQEMHAFRSYMQQVGIPSGMSVS